MIVALRRLADAVDQRRAAKHLTEALLSLAGSATGARLAHETLREMDP